MTEAERAAAWRAAQASGWPPSAPAWLALRGSAAAAQALRAQWQPVMDWLRERNRQDDRTV
jgi:hypothetical protein